MQQRNNANLSAYLCISIINTAERESNLQQQQQQIKI
jgi:hypothetical protein